MTKEEQFSFLDRWFGERESAADEVERASEHQEDRARVQRLRMRRVLRQALWLSQQREHE